MKLFAKVDFQQFKKGDALPDVPAKIGLKLVAKGLAEASKPKPKAKKKANVKPD